MLDSKCNSEGELSALNGLMISKTGYVETVHENRLTKETGSYCGEPRPRQSRVISSRTMKYEDVSAQPTLDLVVCKGKGIDVPYDME